MKRQLLSKSIIKIINIGCYKQGKIFVHIYCQKSIIVYDSAECTAEFLSIKDLSRNLYFCDSSVIWKDFCCLRAARSDVSNLKFFISIVGYVYIFQGKSCIEKYGRYAQQAKDPELKNLFQTLQQKEREHYDSLERVLNGEVPQCNCNDSDGRDYQPKATYTAMSSPEDKQQDAFLATDCIATEKLVSGEYNSEVFAFGDSGVRKLLADIQVEEQNHAEMLYKYKTVNGMV